MYLGEAREQRRVVEGLRSALKCGRIAHAYIFSGPVGAGKKKVACGLAASLLCSAQRDGYACGSCKDCIQCKSGNHPDLLEIYPKGASVRIEQIRDMQKHLGFRSFQGGAQVCIINSADTMTTEASNCLLKTLEEPAGKVIFILITTAPGALLPTILSRCQQMQFPVLKFTEEEGSLREALETLKMIEQAGFLEAIEIAEKYAGLSRENIYGHLGIMSLFLRDVLVWKEAGDVDLLGYTNLLEEIKKMSCRYSACCLVKMIEEVETTTRQIEGRVYARLALEVLFLRLMSLFKAGCFNSESG